MWSSKALLIRKNEIVMSSSKALIITYDIAIVLWILLWLTSNYSVSGEKQQLVHTERWKAFDWVKLRYHMKWTKSVLNVMILLMDLRVEFFKDHLSQQSALDLILYYNYTHQISRNREPSALCSKFYFKWSCEASALTCVRKWKPNSGEHNETAANRRKTGREKSLRIDITIFHDDLQNTRPGSRAWKRDG